MSMNGSKTREYTFKFTQGPHLCLKVKESTYERALKIAQEAGKHIPDHQMQPEPIKDTRVREYMKEWGALWTVGRFTKTDEHIFFTGQDISGVYNEYRVNRIPDDLGYCEVSLKPAGSDVAWQQDDNIYIIDEDRV